MKHIKKLPSLNALKVFEVVRRHLNFNMAAEELKVTQSAVAQQIRGLEETLGIKLFERHAKGVRLTGNGHHYAHRIGQAFQIIEEANQFFILEKQNITVSVTPTFATKWLIPRLVDFSQEYRDIELQVLATEKILHFKNDGVDLAIRYGQVPLGAGLNIELLVLDHFIVVASPKLIAKNGDNIDIKKIQEFTLIHDAHQLWSIFFNELNVDIDLQNCRHLRFNQTALAIDAALTGQGIALVNKMFVYDQIQAGTLIQLFAHSLEQESGFYMVSPRYVQDIESLEKVKHWLRGQFLKINN